jgi:hypothetical protein
MTMTFESPEEEQGYRAHFQHFDREAHVVVEGARYALTEEDFEELAMAARRYAFHPSDLNSSVYSGIVSRARARLRPPLGRAQILALCAATLRSTVERVEESLAWTANYMAFHDGGDPTTEHPYPPTEP